MNGKRYLLGIGMLAFAVQAEAGWLDDTVDEVIDKVRSIFTTATHDVKDTAADLKRQLTAMQQQGETVKETVTDSLGFLTHRRTRSWTSSMAAPGGAAKARPAGIFAWTWRRSCSTWRI